MKAITIYIKGFCEEKLQRVQVALSKLELEWINTGAISRPEDCNYITNLNLDDEVGNCLWFSGIIEQLIADGYKVFKIKVSQVKAVEDIQVFYCKRDIVQINELSLEDIL